MSKRMRFFVSDDFFAQFPEFQGKYPAQPLNERLRRIDFSQLSSTYPESWEGNIVFRVSIEDEIADQIDSLAKKLIGDPHARTTIFLRAMATPISEAKKEEVIEEKVFPNSEEEPQELSEAQLAELRADLLTKLAELIQLREALRTQPMETHADVLDQAQSFMEENARQDRILRINQQIFEIDAALKRMDEGEYGFCEESGEPIGYARLKVNPTARYCIAVQEKKDRQRKFFATNS